MIAGLLRFLFIYFLLGFLLRLAGRSMAQFRRNPVRRDVRAAAPVDVLDAEDVDFEEIKQDR